MLDWLEKGTWVLAILVVVATAGFFFVAGAPSSTPYIALESREVSKSDVLKSLSKEGKQKLTAQLNKPPPTSGDPKKGSERSRRAAQKQPKFIKINPEFYQRYRNRADALQEAKNASHRVIDNGALLAAASADFKFATAVAAFGMQLRNSELLGAFSSDNILDLAEQGRGVDRHGHRQGFVRLVEQAQTLLTTRAALD